MTTLLKNWHFMRIFRAAIAFWIFVEVWRTEEWILLLPGGIFALQAIFDVGCCGASGCAAPQQYGYKDTQSAPDEVVVYEEVR